jgi:hypothetical protein
MKHCKDLTIELMLSKPYGFKISSENNPNVLLVCNSGFKTDILAALESYLLKVMQLYNNTNNLSPGMMDLYKTEFVNSLHDIEFSIKEVPGVRGFVIETCTHYPGSGELLMMETRMICNHYINDKTLTWYFTNLHKALELYLI